MHLLTMKINKPFFQQLLLRLAIYLCLVLFLLHPTSDPDLGWHIRYGEYFFRNQKFLTEDIFSWTMPGFGWYSVSWIYDLYVAAVFPIAGFLGLSISALFVLLISYFFLFKDCNVKYYWKLLLTILFIYFIQPLSGSGFRVQLFEILFIAFLSYLFRKFDTTQKSKYLIFLPFIFFFWCNIHGSFVIGFLMIVLYLISHVFSGVKAYYVSQSKTYLKKSVVVAAVTAISLLMIFATPFKTDIFSQVLLYDPGKMVEGVAEWYPVAFPSEMWLVMTVWTIALLTVVLKNRKNPSGFYQSFTVLIFSYLAFKSKRMVGPYFAATLPFVLDFLGRENRFGKKLFSQTNALLLVFLFTAFVSSRFFDARNILQIFNFNMEKYCLAGPNCSLGALSYLKKNPLPERSFTPYNIGGFLIWQNPQTKVFVDGRMDQWKKEDYIPFHDHQEMSYKNNVSLFERYRFDGVYTFPNTDIDKHLRNNLFWEKKYQDQYAVIYLRKKGNE